MTISPVFWIVLGLVAACLLAWLVFEVVAGPPMLDDEPHVPDRPRFYAGEPWWLPR